MMPVILLLSFISIALLAWFVMSSATIAFDRFSESLATTAETNLRQLFLFTDTRKLLAAYLGVLFLLPLVALLSGLGLLISGIAFVLMLMVPGRVYAKLADRRRRTINEALPDALLQIAGAMKAGATFIMAVQSYVEEQDSALSQELSLLLREQRVGARLEDALDNLAERVRTEEMDLVVSASLIANDVGGNLAEIFESLAETIRRKLEMEGKITSLTAQGRLQGIVVSALPFGILLPLSYFEPDATLPIFHSLLGWTFLAVITVMVITGGVIISRIVRVDI